MSNTSVFAFFLELKLLLVIDFILLFQCAFGVNSRDDLLCNIN